jgi:hypothetical protein
MNNIKYLSVFICAFIINVNLNCQIQNKIYLYVSKENSAQTSSYEIFYQNKKVGVLNGCGRILINITHKENINIRIIDETGLIDSFLFENNAKDLYLSISKSLKFDFSKNDVSTFKCIQCTQVDNSKGQFTWNDINSFNPQIIKIRSFSDEIKNSIKEKVEAKINSWQKKGKFEKTSEYLQRVNEKTRNDEMQKITQELFDSLAVSQIDTKIKSTEYDADNECFKLNFSNVSPVIIKVPRVEAQSFDDNLNKLLFSNYKFSLNDSGFVILHVEISNSYNNRKYTYDRNDIPEFSSTNLTFNFENLDINLPETNNSPKLKASSEKADIEKDIPVNNIKKPNSYALIIGNEDYNSYQNGLNSEINIPYAINDSRLFKEYAVKVMGVPIDNIIYKTNCKVVEMNREIEKLRVIMKNSGGNAEVIVYYAGHGFPDEITKESYIMPVDVSAVDLRYAIKLDELYSKLTEYKSKRVTIFLDACFSGGARNSGLLSARGVKIKPKENILNGNLVVFSATSGDQSALPFKEKGHGLFTYYVLKKLQETQGNLTYDELSNYLNQTVAVKSALVNNKEQNPQTIVSPQITDVWRNWSFK